MVCYRCSMGHLFEGWLGTWWVRAQILGKINTLMYVPMYGVCATYWERQVGRSDTLYQMTQKQNHNKIIVTDADSQSLHDYSGQITSDSYCQTLVKCLVVYAGKIIHSFIVLPTVPTAVLVRRACQTSWWRSMKRRPKPKVIEGLLLSILQNIYCI